MREKAWRRAAKFHQSGIVVRDLELSIGELDRALGIPVDAWTRIDPGERGFSYFEPGATAGRRVRARYARAQSGGTVYQLIAPEGMNTVWSRWLAEGRPLFALAHFVDDVQDSVDQVTRAGAKRLAWGQTFENGGSQDYCFVELPVTGIVIEVMGVTPKDRAKSLAAPDEGI
jgi:hypothetical protein